MRKVLVSVPGAGVLGGEFSWRRDFADSALWSREAVPDRFRISPFIFCGAENMEKGIRKIVSKIEKIGNKIKIPKN